jgi:large subunit ribosomal protein L9
MQIILLQDVEKLGLRGDVVDVARGYARNFLLPRQLAEVATKAKVAELEKREVQRARHDAQTTEQAKGIASRLDSTELRFDVNAGPTGTLFGSVTPTDIADEIYRVAKVRVDRRKIHLDEPIKRIGRYEVEIGVFEDVTATVRTMVVPEGGELPPEEEEQPIAEETAEPEVAAEAAPDVVDEAPVETAPPGMPEPLPEDELVQEVAAGTLGPTVDEESG